MLTEEQNSSLNLISKSEFYIRMILSGILLSYQNLQLSKQEILTGEESTLSEVYRLGASFFVVTALIYFFCLSESLFKENNNEENRRNFIASLFTLAAALLRFPKSET